MEILPAETTVREQEVFLFTTHVALLDLRNPEVFDQKNSFECHQEDNQKNRPHSTSFPDAKYIFLVI